MPEPGTEKVAWTEHDGGPCPTRLLRPGLVYQVQYDVRCGVWYTEPLHPDCPAWLWSWKKVRVGWFRREWRRVCDVPGYAAIVRFRPIYPKGFQVLKRIAEAPDTITVPRETPAKPAYT